MNFCVFFFSSRRRHTRCSRDWSSDVCSSDLRIDHYYPACSSIELYRGILGGRSRGVFNGNIYVRKDAQKTVARQTNKNLLLSNEAFVDSTPGLEILADDVKCNHSSTIGQLDENAV